MIEKQNRKLEERVVEITGDEQRKEKRMKRNEDSWRNLWDNIKCTNISITISEGEEKEKGADNIFEDIIAENFPNIGKEIVQRVQEVWKVTYRINPKSNAPKHIVIKMTKRKRENIKSSGERQQITYQAIKLKDTCSLEGKLWQT